MSEFSGYHRNDGQVGVRNILLVLSTGGLTGQTARRIGQSIAGAVTVALPYGIRRSASKDILRWRAVTD